MKKTVRPKTNFIPDPRLLFLRCTSRRSCRRCGLRWRVSFWRSSSNRSSSSSRSAPHSTLRTTRAPMMSFSRLPVPDGVELPMPLQPLPTRPLLEMPTGVLGRLDSMDRSRAVSSTVPLRSSPYLELGETERVAVDRHSPDEKLSTRLGSRACSSS